MQTLKFLRLPNGGDLPLPTYATPGSSGMDICSATDFYIAAGGQGICPTGFAVEIPEGFELQLRPRSGLALKRINIHFGTIDADYRGEIKVIIRNDNDRSYTVRWGERIAQL